MSIKGEPAGLPRMPGQQADVAPGSPLAVVALFTEIVRQRFIPGNGLAWAWSENPTPDPADANDPDSPRKLVVEPAFNVHEDVRNFRPAIYVDKGDTAADKHSINNFVGQQLKTGLKGFHALGTIPMEIEVVSDQKGESAILADITWFYLLAGREQIRATFGLHEFSNPTLGKTMPFEADKQQWSTKISFTVQVDLRWTTVPVSPLLAEIVARFKKSGETNPDAFLLTKYIR